MRNSFRRASLLLICVIAVVIAVDMLKYLFPYFQAVLCSASAANDSDKADASTSGNSKQVKHGRGRPKIVYGTSPALVKPRALKPTPATADTTSELSEGLLVSAKDGRALASQLELKKKYSNNYRNPENLK